MVSWDKIPAATISRAYTGHHQITLTILDNDGGNDFLHSKGGLHFGIRKIYLHLEDGTGVACVLPVQTQLSTGLKFKPTDVSEWVVEDFLSENELEILSDRMEVENIPHDLFTYWRNYGFDSEDYGLDSEDYDEP